MSKDHTRNGGNTPERGPANGRPERHINNGDRSRPSNEGYSDRPSRGPTGITDTLKPPRPNQ